MISALSFLTIFGRPRSPTRTTLLWFPFVGALLGLALGGLWWSVAKAWPPLPCAALILVADLVLTGLLHFDGLADSADGLLAPLSKERRLEAMADPAIGAFGAIAVGAVLLLRFAALATQPPSVFALAGLWCASRTLMVTLTKFLPYARPDGLVQDFLGDQETRRQRWATFTSIVFGLLLSGTFLVIAKGAKGLGALAGELVAMALVGALSSRRIDGYTGDVLGAAGVIGETVGLLILVTR